MVSGLLATSLVLATFGLLFFRQLRVYPLTRAITAATGAVLLLALGAITPTRALESVHTGTILLLFGMLAHVEALSRSGFYGWAAAQLVRRSHSTTQLTIGTLCLAAVCSAFALNDAIVLLLTPILVHAVKQVDTDPVPPLIAVVIGANIGSVATPLGNPQNAYILSRSSLTTVEFVRTLAPIALGSLLIAAIGLRLIDDTTPLNASVSVPDIDRGWTLSSGGFLLGTFVLMAAIPSINAGVIAASMGIVHLAWLQLFRRVPGDEILAEMDWSILILFVGLFVLIGGLEGTRLVAALQTIGSGWRLAIATFLLSNLVSNVPATVLLSTSISEPTGWYLLAAVSTLAGNATPIASAATLIVLDQASRLDVEISVLRLMKVGVPIAVLTSVFAAGVILLLC